MPRGSGEQQHPQAGLEANHAPCRASEFELTNGGVNPALQLTNPEAGFKAGGSTKLTTGALRTGTPSNPMSVFFLKKG